MTPPTGFWDALDATWPAFSTEHVGPFLVRDGAGGGKRVSAATALGPASEADIIAAEAHMLEPLFQVRDEPDLDQTLDARGYQILDPTLGYAGRLSDLADPNLHRLAAVPAERPVAIQAEIWAAGGIGPERLAVMDRVSGPKSYLLGRQDDRPVAAAFVAISGKTAMLHALEVKPEARRKGVGRNLTIGAANWAAKHGAATLALLVTEANTAANALYSALGMARVARYHYRALSKRCGE